MIELEYKFALFKSRVNTITGNTLIQLDELKADIDLQFDALLPEPEVESIPDSNLNWVLSNAARQQNEAFLLTGLQHQSARLQDVMWNDYRRNRNSRQAGLLDCLGGIFH